jgi:hypothetical protein
MALSKSMRHLVRSCLLALMSLLVGVPALAQDDDIQLIPDGAAAPTKSQPPPAKSQPAPAKTPPATPGEIEIRGMHCTPDVKEVETRRPIPISCAVDYPVSGVELRYRMEGDATKWEKVDLKESDGRYTGTIPCGATGSPGSLKVYLFARNEDNKVVARVGRHENPLSVRVVEHSKLAPPALPGQAAPARCYEQNECPPELVGTPSCPGTHVVKAAKKGWGATCAASDECQTSLECVKGSCESPAKCEDAKDCAEGGECTDGLCHFPTAAELKERIGPAKHHWIGLHAGVDFYVMGGAQGVCGGSTADSKHFGCFDGGNEYTGTPNVNYAGTVKGNLAVATVRALFSYEYMFDRISLGARVGWAFRGAPKDFSPLHVEARVHYSLSKNPFNANFRPYLGLALGHAPVDASQQVLILDCVAPDTATRDDCVGTADPNKLKGYLQDPNLALERKLNAFHHGAGFFFGPSLMLIYALANDSALVFNLTAMLPDVTFEPTLGYEMGL